jgi:CheY-like chemotaxis protein
MWVDSQVGVGSTLTVELPIKGPPATEEESGLEALSNQRLILAIDDDPDVIELYHRYLQKQNYQVVGLSDSEEAVEKTRELRPYAILLDLLMPNKDGWTVIQELKSDPETRDIPVIISSIVSAGGRGFCFGAADYLLKPIDENRLLAALASLEDGSENGRESPRRVLIIDDTPEDRQLLRRVLESAPHSYTVIEAAGGLEGLEMIHETPPDIVILDLMMPEMDGLSILESLKREGDVRDIPIIIVTAKALTEPERIELDGQVAALYQKGLFKAEELLQDVNFALHRFQKPSREKEIKSD